ncbi:MAG: endonuclease/exonuclease/phosphatase family protein [Lachnoclostridium sp.]|nr:endonuclease/exonuclease/phosphatase family protein [Lachnoclostridium sp.]
MSKSTVKPFVTTLLSAALKAVMTAVTVAVAFATIFSAYGGCFDPDEVPVAALAAMALPAILIAGLMLTLINCLISWKLALVIPVSWLVSLKPLLIFFPLNVSSPSVTPEQEAHSFTLMTYNVQHFDPYVQGADYKENPTVEFILSKKPDVVCLQEAQQVMRGDIPFISNSQYDSICAIYPYRTYITDRDCSIYSRYPIKRVDIKQPIPTKPCNVITYMLTVDSVDILLCDVHLRSIGLQPDDKQLYRELPSHLRSENQIREEIREVKSQLVSKLATSFSARKLESEWLRNAIDSIGCPNVIVAGDFNDIPGCYAQRIIMDGDMTDAYARCAFGPRITYHDNWFYFRIDHILYRGDLEAVKIKRFTPQCSDHYPLMATFVIK